MDFFLVFSPIIALVIVGVVTGVVKTIGYLKPRQLKSRQFQSILSYRIKNPQNPCSQHEIQNQGKPSVKRYLRMI